MLFNKHFRSVSLLPSLIALLCLEAAKMNFSGDGSEEVKKLKKQLQQQGKYAELDSEAKLIQEVCALLQTFVSHISKVKLRNASLE